MVGSFVCILHKLVDSELQVWTPNNERYFHCIRCNMKNYHKSIVYNRHDIHYSEIQMNKFITPQMVQKINLIESINHFALCFDCHIFWNILIKCAHNCWDLTFDRQRCNILKILFMVNIVRKTAIRATIISEEWILNYWIQMCKVAILVHLTIGKTR